VFGFDPDVDECVRLNALAREQGDSTTTYVPIALGPDSGIVTLYETADPACSSIYPPITALVDAFAELACMSPTGQQPIGVTTLDEWCTEHAVTHIDMLKLDTQGSELGVLQGATSILTTVLLLEIEVEFNPLYQGQPLFGDVDTMLRSHGFMLWRLDNMVHYSAHSSGSVRMGSLAFYDSLPFLSPALGGQLYWGHAYYTRGELCPGSSAPALHDERQRTAMLADAAGLTDLSAFLRDSR
jgi:FkbM family methyltransferase